MWILRIAIASVCIIMSSHIGSADDRLLTSNDLSRPVAEDPYAKERTVGQTLVVFDPAWATPQSQTVHAVIIVDEHAVGIEEAVRRDRSAIAKLLERSFDQPGPKLDMKIIAAEGLTPRNVVRQISSLKINEGDSLFVYYSGHGETETTDEVTGTIPTAKGPLAMHRAHHVFRFGGKGLARANVRTAMERTGARLKVLITDCCRPPAKGLTGARAPLNPDFKVLDNFDLTTVNKPVVRGLFTNYSGFIDVSTADALSSPQMGGVLTHSFVGACCYQKPDFVSQPRTARRKGLNIAPTRIDRDKDGIIKWREFNQLWLHLIISASGAEQSVLMDTY